ncbi:conserved hypothetical protein [Arthrobacter sp. 9V]|nr:conserved hypothetical protein [Arthrobacter sp. 9V]
MTATTSEVTSVGTPVGVRFSPMGAPLAVRHDGRIWVVVEDSVHWFARDSWWETRRTAPVGIGNLVDIEYWRVQVKPSANAALRTFTLRLEPLAEQWVLETIS